MMLQVKYHTEAKFTKLWHLVGNTPMIEIHYRHEGKINSVFAKCEHYNLTGSIKDRMALYILQKAYQLGLIQPGDRIVEASSGNTGISFSALGVALGHPVSIVMPDWLSRERTDIICSLGAEVIPVSKAQGGFVGSIALAESMAGKSGIFLPRQFENCYNAEAHEHTTATEIVAQLASRGLEPSAFVAGVGTGGTVMGVRNYFSKSRYNVHVHPLEPLESPTLSTGYKIGNHRIQGISDEFIPAIVRLEQLDSIIKVSDGDAIIMAQQLAKKLGLGVGISSGANIVGAIKLKNTLPADAVVVTVLTDSNKKYLSTDLLKNEPVKDGYLSSQIELLDYLPIARCDCR